MRRLLAIIGIVLAPALLSAATIEGRVVLDDEPLAGVTVAAYHQSDPNAAPVARSVPSDDEGRYQLELPAGSYALFGWSGTKDLFAFSGRNPITLGEKQHPLWVGLQAVAVAEARVSVYDDEYAAAVEGVVQYRGEPVAGAYVSLYLDAAEDLKGQGYRLSLPSASDGFFRFDGLPESDYFLVARARQNGQKVGPVVAGDLYGVYAGNPLTAQAGQVQSVTLPLVEKLKEEAGENSASVDGPVLRGMVTDVEGRGVAGVHVFAYVDRVIGHQRPAAVSTPTGADGGFIVNLPTAGTYYVGARQHYGDSPAPGELFGMYEETADHGLTVETGQTIEGIRIVVEAIEI